MIRRERANLLMPELPEVQTVVNDLISAGIVGLTVTDAKVFWARTVSGMSAKRFCQKIKDLTLCRVGRRGKFLVFEFYGGEHLLIHLRMSGRLLFGPSEESRSKHERVILKFNDTRQLRFHDTRKFGRFYLTVDPDSILGRLGPEPLDPTFSSDRFTMLTRTRNRKIKPLLLDQSFVAGIGNIYADEALWEAGIHPERIAEQLSGAEIKSLYRAIRKVLRKGLKNLGTSLGNGKTNFFSIAGSNGRNREQLNVFRRTGLACPRCKREIARIVVGQRGSHICEYCQPARTLFKGGRI